MPSETWPLERIGQTVVASFLFFGTCRFLMEKVIIPAIWSRFNELEPKVQKDLCVRCTSIVHSVITSYNAYYVLTDDEMYKDQLRNVSDQHFLTVSILSGYFVYDTLMVLSDLQAEEDAAGAFQTMLHHIFVLGTLPVGLVTNTWAYNGSGVLTFWTEITGPGLNFIWILRTTLGDLHWMYAANGLIFGVTFTFIRVFVLGYHTFQSGLILWENWDGIDPDGDGPLKPVVCNTFLPDLTPSAHGSCQFGFWLMFGLWAIGLLWVPPVIAKVYQMQSPDVVRGVTKFFAGEDEKPTAAGGGKKSR